MAQKIILDPCTWHKILFWTLAHEAKRNDVPIR